MTSPAQIANALLEGEGATQLRPAYREGGAASLIAALVLLFPRASYNDLVKGLELAIELTLLDHATGEFR